MALTRDEFKLVETAIKRKSLITFKYFPNKYPIVKGKSNIRLKGIRKVKPYKFIQKNGRNYLLAYFIDGASLSNALGYNKLPYGWRLYFLKNMFEAKYYKPNVKNIKIKGIDDVELSMYNKIKKPPTDFEINRMILLKNKLA